MASRLIFSPFLRRTHADGMRFSSAFAGERILQAAAMTRTPHAVLRGLSMEAAPLEAPVMEFKSENVKGLFERMATLDRSELDLVGRLINEKLGIVISEFELAGGAPGTESGGDVAEEPEVVEAKTAWDLKLMGYDAKSKIKVIKEVRATTGLGLKEAKELVEGAPKTVKKGIKLEEAEELKAKLEALGATIELV
uniref:Large ribosomal subunit protein bL12 C-terminal domain-containing protein n=1 Tax=Attheya septentrionalis TaxID=420275 RepID=A0A7S2UEZ2_9STRA|mmetsp:Transcript_21206/g.38275  ORF Transcript_21206/g.38275 Transcript_21206/m.38275 type:complete len:195 (+) Transcript_21206:133-717(+)